MENYPLSSLPLVVMSVLAEIQSSSDYVNTARGWTLEQLEELTSNDPCKYKLYLILDDTIIYSRCFKFVECLI